MRYLLPSTGAMAVFVGYVTVVAAGVKHDDSTGIDAVHITTAPNPNTYGAFGAARNSTDSNQAIGCIVTASATGELINCFAHDASNVQLNCLSTASNHITSARGLSTSSFLAFDKDPSTGLCASVVVNTGSTFTPKL